MVLDFSGGEFIEKQRVQLFCRVQPAVSHDETEREISQQLASGIGERAGDPC